MARETQLGRKLDPVIDMSIHTPTVKDIYPHLPIIEDVALVNVREVNLGFTNLV